MKERLAQFLAAEGVSRNDFANVIGVQRSNITHILDGRNKPSFDFIEKMLSAYPQVNADWLLLGRGNMYKKPTMGSLFPTEEGAPEAARHIAPKPVTPPVPIPPAPSPLDQMSDRGSSAATSADSMQKIVTTAAVGKQVERIIILYTDKSFDFYHPS